MHGAAERPRSGTHRRGRTVLHTDALLAALTPRDSLEDTFPTSIRQPEEALNTRRCPSCGHANRAEAKFCEECATPFARRCPSCGAAPTTAAREHDPRAYTPKHLAEKILGARAALEGERKQVTVLFADVKGSMELAEEVDPEVFHQVMERFAALLAEGVHRFEGTVTQFTGDGLMALFGAPIAHEDHAQRACYAALHLSEEWTCPRPVNTSDVGVSPRGGGPDEEAGGGERGRPAEAPVVHGGVQG